MRILLLILLFISFAYALGLVLANNTDVGVNLLFSQAPAMNLGLLLILCLILGVVIGMLLSLLLFRVFQNKWELSRLQKNNVHLQEQLNQANIVIDRQANVPTVEETIYHTDQAPLATDIRKTDAHDNALLTKHKHD